MKYAILLLTILCLAACSNGGGSGGSSPANASMPLISAPTPTPGPSPTPTPTGPTPVMVTYYTVTTDVYEVGIGESTTMTASCAVYLNNTYCWDDGVHLFRIIANEQEYQFDYSYFGLDSTSGLVACAGDCHTDPVTSPTLFDQNIMNLVSSSAYNFVFSGDQGNITCSMENNIVDCVDFQINLGQTPY